MIYSSIELMQIYKDNADAKRKYIQRSQTYIIFPHKKDTLVC